MTGTIKRLMEKGFGFISSEEFEKDIFFHMSQIVGVTFDELAEGTVVTFEVEETQRGLQAINVTPQAAE